MCVCVQASTYDNEEETCVGLGPPPSSGEGRCSVRGVRFASVSQAAGSSHAGGPRLRRAPPGAHTHAREAERALMRTLRSELTMYSKILSHTYDNIFSY